MGSPPSEVGRQSNELQRLITLSEGFWIGQREITERQWENLMHTTVAQQQAVGNKDFHLPAQGSNYPMVFINWEDCDRWIARMNDQFPPHKRWRWALPTEAQWEYACRAGTQEEFGLPGEGSKFGVSYLSSRMANFHGEKPYGNGANRGWLQRTAPVGSYLPNQWGIFDMHANVGEWCADWYAPYNVRETEDPKGALTGRIRCCRGGCWGTGGAYTRSAFRGLDFGDDGGLGLFSGSRATESENDSYYRVNYMGFRPVIIPKN